MHLIHRMAEEEKEKKPYPKGKAPQSIQDFCTTTILGFNHHYICYLIDPRACHYKITTG